MRQLILEYVLEGRQRGYTFTSPTQGFNDDTLKHVWRTAMPRGQGWGAPQFVGARSLKVFLLLDGRVGLSDVVVTGQTDESGRAGIRRAVIDILQPGEYHEALRGRLRQYSSALQAEVHRKTWFGRRVPRPNGERQVVCSHPFLTPDAWQLVEVLVIHSAIESLERGWLGGKVIPFTTLALDYREEAALVVLPEHKAREIDKVHVTPIR